MAQTYLNSQQSNSLRRPDLFCQRAFIAISKRDNVALSPLLCCQESVCKKKSFVRNRAMDVKLGIEDLYNIL